MKPDVVDCCKTLGLPWNPIPSIHDIKDARRTLVKKFHPDLHHSIPHKLKDCEEKTKSINAACDILLAALRHFNPGDWIPKTRKTGSNQNSETKNSNTTEKNEGNYRTNSEKEDRRSAKRKQKARSRQYRKVFFKFERLAKKGIAEAQYHLAVLYKNGQGCIRDKVEALRWFKKAAAGGAPKALVYLGFAFAWGIDLPTDSLKAIRLFNEAAEKGLAEAYFQLGLMHYFGFGVKQEFESAVKLYRKAVEQGYRLTDRTAETCGHFRTETPKEYFKYYRWYLLAIQRVPSD